MKIQHLIDRLNKHPNKDAEVIINTNLTNIDIEQYDVISKLEILREDDFMNDYVDLIVSNNRLPIDRENCIDCFFEDNNKLFIELDSNKGIFITNEDGDLLRELELKSLNRDYNKTEIIKKLQQIL